MSDEKRKPAVRQISGRACNEEIISGERERLNHIEALTKRHNRVEAKVVPIR